MPTVTVDPRYALYTEVADLNHEMDEYGIHPLGYFCRGFRHNDGRYGNYNYGFHTTDTSERLPGAFNVVGWREFVYYDEGHHLTYRTYEFKDFGARKGDTIQSAILSLSVSMGPVMATKLYDPNGEFINGMPCKAYAVKEPNFRPRNIDFTGSYMSQKHIEHQPQDGYTRRYRCQSFESNMRHTLACVNWIAPADSYLVVPDLKDVVQEVIDQDGWEDGNLMCLIVCTDGITRGYGTPEEIGAQPHGIPGTLTPDAASVLFPALGSPSKSIPNSEVPIRLTVTY